MKKSPEILTAVQARMSSTRLPGKVMLPLVNEPLLLKLYRRIKRSEMCGTVVVITSDSSSDDPVFDLCLKEGIEVFRGHPSDLLDRHYKAAVKYSADHIIKIPSDCPLISPSVINKVVSFYLVNDFDYVSNLHPPTYPDGNDVEIMRFDALEKSWKEAKKPFEREHTTPYIWDNPELFKIGNVEWETGSDYSLSHRWTIDYPEDYSFINKVYTELARKEAFFEIDDILELLNRKPELSTINSRYLGVNWYRNHLNELRTIDISQTRRIEDEKIN